MKRNVLAVAVLGTIIAASGAAYAEGHKGPRGHHGDKMFEKIDTNKDGAISKAESQAFNDAKFTAMDANKDGKVTKEEAKAHFDAKRAEWKAKREAAGKAE